MSVIKELNFFTLNQEKGIHWYASHFRGNAKVYGETSPSYTDFPLRQGVPAHMHALIPDARLIYSVRHPVERIRSHYRHWYSEGKENRSFAEVIRDIEDSPYLNLSKYHLQLEQYLPFYSPARILLISQEELLDSRLETLLRIFSFLEVDPAFYCPEFSAIRNRSRDNRRHNRFGRIIARIIAATGLKNVSADLAWKIEWHLCYPFSQFVPRPLLDEKSKLMIRAYLKDDHEKLCRFAGRDFPEWSWDEQQALPDM